MLLAALGVGLAGGSFAVGIAYVSKWYPPDKQGTALGIFGAGNVGAAVTKFTAPFVLVAFGWEMVAQAWAAALVVMAVVFWFTTDDDPEYAFAEAKRGKGPKRFSAARSAEVSTGLALRDLLLLRLRGLRRAGPLAAALSGWRLRTGHQDGRYPGGVLFGAGEYLPGLRRSPFRQIRRPDNHVLDIRRLGGVLLPTFLSGHRLCRARDRGVPLASPSRWIWSRSSCWCLSSGSS